MNEREDRYLKCETITGEWWYKDLKTGEDLPLYSTPIRGLEYDENGIETFNRWQDPTINELQQQLDKYKNVVDKIKEYIHHEYFKREQLGIVDKTFYACDMKGILELLEEVNR